MIGLWRNLKKGEWVQEDGKKRLTNNDNRDTMVPDNGKCSIGVSRAAVSVWGVCPWGISETAEAVEPAGWQKPAAAAAVKHRGMQENRGMQRMQEMQ